MADFFLGLIINTVTSLIMDLTSGYPFWLIKDGLPFSYPKLQKDIHAEVVILGGGISGALVAYYLVKAGVDCVILDKRTIGLGSTSASTSLLQYEIDTALSVLLHKAGVENAVRAYRLCDEAIDKLEAIAKETGLRFYEYRGSLYYAANKKHVPFLKEEYEVRKRNGFKVSYLDAGSVKDQYDFNAPAAIFSDHAAQTDAYLFTHCLHQHNIKRGAQIFDRSAIVKIEEHKNAVKLSTTEGNIIVAKKIVYATGYEVVNFIKKPVVKLKSTYAVASEHFEKQVSFWKDNTLIWNTADPYLYMSATNDDRIIIGGRDEEFYDAGKRDKLIEQKSEQLVNDFKKLFPHISFVPEFKWAGTFGSTKDGLPYIGTYNGKPHSYFALGFGGNGIIFSQVAGEIIADLITGKKNKDVAIFSFSRT